MARPHTPRRQPSIHPLVPAFVAVVVCGVLIALAASIGGDGERAAPPTTLPSTTTTLPPITTTTTTLPDPVDVTPYLAESLAEDPPSSYEVTYDVVENGLARTETWLVRRPFESLVLSERDGATLTGTATSRRALYTYLSDREGWLSIQAELHRAAFDLRPAGAIAAMEALGVAEAAGSDEFLGRRCERYRTGPPPGGGQAGPPTEEEFTEVCIDASGLVLHERWVLRGNPITEKTATEVREGVTVDGSVFDPEPLLEDDDLAQAMSQIAVVPDDDTMERLELEVPIPGGYEYDGAVFRASTTRSGGVSASEIVRFYSSGPDLLEVAEHFSGTAPDLSAGVGVSVRVAVDGWDEVWLEPGFRFSVVRVRTGEYSYAELRHHDVPFLFEVLDSLRYRTESESGSESGDEPRT